jgi:hypothetical protein
VSNVVNAIEHGLLTIWIQSVYVNCPQLCQLAVAGTYHVWTITEIFKNARKRVKYMVKFYFRNVTLEICYRYKYYSWVWKLNVWVSAGEKKLNTTYNLFLKKGSKDACRGAFDGFFALCFVHICCAGRGGEEMCLHQ